MAASLPSPGVQVVQVFKATSPTIITPTLVPCVVGVCKQVVDVLETDASGSSALNPEALETLPGFFLALAGTGNPPLYGGLDTLLLVLSINNGPNVTVTFSGSSLTPASVVAQINDAFMAAGVTEALAETVGTDRFRIRTVGDGDFQTLAVIGGVGGTALAVASAFGIVPGYIYPGRSSYDQHFYIVPPSNLPDPRNNLSQLAVEFASVRAFLALGNGSQIQELKRTESFLRKGGLASAAVLLGSIDLTTLTYSTAAVVTGTADVTAGALYGGGGTLNGLTLKLNVNGGGLLVLTFSGVGNSANLAAMLAAIHVLWPAITATTGGGGGNKLILTDAIFGTGSTIVIDASSTALVALGLTAATTTGVAGSLTNQVAVFSVNAGANQTVTFNNPNNLAALLAQINAVLGSPCVATVNGSNDLLLTTVLTGALASVKAVSGTALVILGLTVGQTALGINGVAAIDDGNGDAVTPLISLNGENFSTAAGQASIQGNVDITALAYPGAVSGKTLILSDGHVTQTYIASAADSVSAVTLTAAIQAFWSNFLVDVNATNIRIRTVASLIGDEAIVQVVGGTLMTVVGLTAQTVRGAPFPPTSGDDLYVDGALLGRITQVAVSGQNAVLKINKQVPINPALGASFYIIAKNLTGAATPTRPSSDLIVDLQNNVVLKHSILRDTTGAANSGNRASVYISYRAVRRDVSALATNPGLLRFDSSTALSDQLAPITTDNPLALGLFFALLNAPGNQVTGLGVDEISADEPFGTVEGFTRAAEYLEAFEVYGLAPLTHDPTVAQVFLSHVVAMSDPLAKGERICVFNPARPTSKIDTLVGSGTNGNSLSGLTLDTGIVNLSQLVLNAGISPIGTIPVSAGLFLDIQADSKHYSITSISGSVVTVKVSGFASGDNDDGFYSTTNLVTPPLPSALIEEPFAVRIRGAKLVLTDGVTPDRDGIAITYQALAQSFSNRRFWQVVPESCAATIGGLEQTIDGFYLCAGIVGMIGKQKPEQSFTNFPMTGYTQVIGTNDFFTQKQMDIMAAGGNYIIIQPAPAGPLLSRFALTTEMTSVETRTDSITKIVDFTAKFLRTGLKNFIGRFNITQGFLDTLGHVLQGLLSFLQETGTLIGFRVTRIIQDENNPDTVLVDVTLDVPFPCNFIKVTLVL